MGNQSEIVQANKYKDEEGDNEEDKTKKKKKWGFNMKGKMPNMKGLVGFGKKKNKGEEGEGAPKHEKKGPKQMAAGKYKMDDIMGGKTKQQKEEIFKRFNADGSVKKSDRKGKRPKTKGIF